MQNISLISEFVQGIDSVASLKAQITFLVATRGKQLLKAEGEYFLREYTSKFFSLVEPESGYFVDAPQSFKVPESGYFVDSPQSFKVNDQGNDYFVDSLPNDVENNIKFSLNLPKDRSNYSVDPLQSSPVQSDRGERPQYDVFYHQTSDSSGDSVEISDSDDDQYGYIIQSQKYVLPKFLTTHLAQGFKWNYASILDELKRCSDFEDYLSIIIRLNHLYEDFVRSARMNAKILIAENWKTNQRMSKVGLPGVAGGNKFIRDSILFKFHSEEDSIYDGIFNAFKAGARELSNASTLFELLYLQYPSYNIPFFAIVDSLGFQVSCIALLPLHPNNAGLCYGSSDGGKSVMKDPLVEKEVEEIAVKLNLASHVVNGVNGDHISISHCTDIEVHQGKDDVFYFLDVARLFPPEAPHWLTNPKSIFYHHLRPEFVTNYSIPLCADAFSAFLRTDPDYKQKGR